MMEKLKSLADSLLFVLNLFLLFLLFFYSRISEPGWVQVIGRMHPLFLHFPIVILLMALLWEWLPLGADPAHAVLYRRVNMFLLLTGALSAVATAIMGLLLSLQGGYEGASLQWHKWTGVAIAFISYAYYIHRSYHPKISTLHKTTGALLAVCLIVGGHLGADITHGSDFLLKPLQAEKKKVPFDQAIVFNDLIKPVLEAKCMSCHNQHKSKGELVMETKALLLKGGKDGKIFEAGHPELSLLIQRIHLPEEDKKHMPPQGKPALTEEESALLYWWIRSGAPFDQKVDSLPATDSLRLLATHFLEVKPKDEELVFDFPAADEKKVQKLSNNYRVVTPLAENSPALVVNFYNKSAYTQNDLKELLELKEQIIDLNLAKMPVKDADLKIIHEFKNLRSLNLNFTDITDAGLAELSGLQKLQRLSVSGTPVSYAALAKISSLPALREVYIWETGLKEPDIARLKSGFKKIAFESGYKDTSETVLPLSPPVIEASSGIFRDSLLVEIRHPIKGVDIRYSLDGSEPDSIHSPSYHASFNVARNTLLKARAYKAGWSGSPDAEAVYFRSSFQPDSIVLLTPPDEKYSGQGGHTLMDKDIGDNNAGTGKWIGYRGKELSLYLLFHQPVDLHNVSMSFLAQTNGYIFLPASFEVWGGTDPAHLKYLGKTENKTPAENMPTIRSAVGCDVPATSVQCIKIVARPLHSIPNWLPDKKQVPWIMASEVLLN